ncbi:L-homoserine-O-acetyltransferase [Thecaphora frezii]
MASTDHLLPAPREIPGPTSPHSNLLAGHQRYLLFPKFTLESGVTLVNVPVAFKTWGKLDPANRSNALVVCHALTGSADVEDWWGPLLGPRKLFDPTRFLIVCCNVLGSPYGSASSCTAGGGEVWPDAADAQATAAKHDEKQRWTGHGWWGPEFPATTPRDDVRIQKLVLDYLGVESIAAVVGGSMGGMAVLEWPLCFPTRFPYSSSRDQATRYIRCIVPIATSARHSAWCISWAEAQRQSIYSDPAFKHGYYEPDEPPRNGLSAARMAALLTYRSRDSFESRFGRRIGRALKDGGAATAATGSGTSSGTVTPTAALPDSKEESKAKALDAERRRSLAQEAATAHNEGNQSPKVREYGQSAACVASEASGANGAVGASQALPGPEGASLRPTATTPPVPAAAAPPSDLPDQAVLGPLADGANPFSTAAQSSSGGNVVEAYSPSSHVPQIFSAQSYLRYQGDKFVKRFDANCYIHLTRKMDAHDVAKGRWGWSRTADGEVRRERGVAPTSEDEEDEALARVLDCLSLEDSSSPQCRVGAPPNVLVVSIESDGLFAPPEQKLIHALIAGSEFVNVVSPDGHDGFLLEFEQINHRVGEFLKRHLGDLYTAEGVGRQEWEGWSVGMPAPGSGEAVRGESGVADAVKESVFGEVEDVTRW